MLADAMRKFPVMPVLGGGGNLMQPVAVRDVAGAYAAAVGSARHVGKVYELGGPDVYYFKDILRIISKAIDKKVIFIPIPTWTARLPVLVLESLGLETPVTTDQLIMLSEDNVRRGGDPVEDLEVTWTPFVEGIGEYLGKKESRG